MLLMLSLLLKELAFGYRPNRDKIKIYAFANTIHNNKHLFSWLKVKNQMSH